MLSDRDWQTISGRKIEDVLKELLELDFGYGGAKIINIGTDSQAHRKHEFVTCIAITSPGHGGTVFYSQERIAKKFGLQEKLFKEAWYSIELALELSPLIPEDWEITVHLDVNPNVKFASSKYYKALAGMVIAQGFEVKVKPDAWAASHVSEHLVKHRHEGRNNGL